MALGQYGHCKIVNWTWQQSSIEKCQCGHCNLPSGLGNR